VFTQGTLESTSSSTDMAIDGNGFFVVSDGQGLAYTRAGNFKLDEDGYLTSNGGLYVQGTMAVRNADGSMTIPQDSRVENLVIPIGSVGGMAKTSTVSFAGNLNSNQKVASGLNLFGSNAPTVSNLQSWMSTAYDSTDTTWNALEEKSFSVSQDLLDAYGLSVPAGSGVTVHSDGVVPTAAYYAIDADGDVASVTDLGFADSPASTDDIVAAGYIPVVQEISTINGGNVQTSQAYGVKVPAYLAEGSTTTYNGVTYTVENSHTYPAWFYEANGGDFSAMAALSEGEIDADSLATVWPDGFQNDGVVPSTVSDLPTAGDTYPATLDTPLEELYAYSNGKWSQVFANIRDGDEITIAFDKGQDSLTATFEYNRPGPEAISGQQSVDYEASYTLGHLMTFLAGDVDDPGTACAAITPAMFGAEVTADYPDGDPASATFDEAAYNEALADLTLAKSTSNQGTDQTGAMGLVDVPPQISQENGGTDAYDSPMETAGAFTRQGVSQVSYQRWDDAKGEYVTVQADSFNISLVSNLGADNALSNISFTYNNATNKSMFSNESEYSSAQGGSATASVTVYDSLGNAHTATVRMTLVEEDSNFSTWRWYADCGDDTDFAWQADPETGELISSLNVGTGLFRFDSEGNFVSGSDYSETGGIVVNLDNQGVDDTIHVSIQNGLNSGKTQDLDFSGLTFSSSTKNSVSLAAQNGSPPGTLDKFEVTTDGTIYGIYSTGATTTLGRLVLATIPNETGMPAGSGRRFYTT
ncbi:MAG: flagellar hook-basal body complex protein, partial [Planctomycetes bacterium]|nr:flagellar hook-basal body complex protein [Planctomycetota bacterium]